MFNFSLHFSDSSPYWVLFCALIASIYTAVLYYANSSYTKKRIQLFASLRWLVVFLLMLFLFSPMITLIGKRVEKPILVFAQDNSNSILKNNRASFYQQEYQQQLQVFKDNCAERFQIAYFNFGNDINEQSSLTFSESKTNISKVFNDISSNYKNRNLAAVVLATDGIFNIGADPLYELDGISAPVFTVRLGDSIPQKDVAIKNVLANKIVYKGNSFSMLAEIKAFDLRGKKAMVSVFENDKILQKREVLISQENFYAEIPIVLEANEVGLRTYSVHVDPISGEKNKINNNFNVYIEVIEGMQKIAIIANAPHPDIAALKAGIESNLNYKATVFYANQISLDLVKDFQLLILHQLPSGENTLTALFKKLEQERIPTLSVIGTQTYLDLMSRANPGFSIKSRSNAPNEVFPIWSQNFYLFSLSDECKEVLLQMPPLLAPFGEYQVLGSTQVLASQRIGSVASTLPLICFGNNNGVKSGWIAAEGIWKWRMANFKLKQNFKEVDELLSKSIQYLSSKEDKRKFRVQLKSNEWNKGESILFNAELYDNSYELLNTPDVFLRVKNSKNKSFDFVFSKTGNAYSLNSGNFAPGNYTYVANTQLGTEKFSYAGKFTVREIELESINTTADFNLLRAISQKTNAASFADSQLSTLSARLMENENFKSISYDQKETNELIDLKWLMVILIGLLSAEWYLRKYFGGY